MCTCTHIKLRPLDSQNTKKVIFGEFLWLRPAAHSILSGEMNRRAKQRAKMKGGHSKSYAEDQGTGNFKQNLTQQLQLASDSQQSACLSLNSSEFKGMQHNTWLGLFDSKVCRS